MHVTCFGLSEDVVLPVYEKFLPRPVMCPLSDFQDPFYDRFETARKIIVSGCSARNQDLFTAILGLQRLGTIVSVNPAAVTGICSS